MTTILIVDDDTRKIRAASLFLVEHCNIIEENISSATDADQARKLLTKHAFDILLLDILLPVNGVTEPSDKTSIDLVIELSTRDIYFKPKRIIGFTAFDGLSDLVINSFSSRAWTLIKYSEDSLAWQQFLKNAVDYVSGMLRNKPAAEYDVDLCIITALLTPELSAVKRLDWNWQPDTPIDDNTWASYGEFKSNGELLKVVALSAPRMGLVSTALISAKAIGVFRPRFLVMCGICAGVSGKVDLGDVLVANPSWNWQSGKHSASKLGPHFAAAPHPLQLPEFLRSRVLQLNSYRNALAEIKALYPGTSSKTELILRCGPVASGSAVVADEEVLAPLLEIDRGMIGLEMEIYGMYAAAIDASFPRPSAIAFKSVCDFGTIEKNDIYQTYAAHTSAQVMGLFFEKFGSEVRQYAGTS